MATPDVISPKQEHEEPRPIRRLEEALVNRIAAGEIIHRPASALKELLENALDAGSTQIKVTAKDGGLKLLQIQDNGCGIRKSDLPILCERFTTSKLSTFSDLQRLVTYGFRGEALASISHVSHLSVITKTHDESCAWKAHYADGVLTAPKPGLSADPRPCAGNNGTTITAEDLFYNTPTRLSSLRSSSDEYARIVDVITRYATHNPHVSFTCKKIGSASPDVLTPSSSSVASTIKLLYGPSVARELISVGVTSNSLPQKNKGSKRPKDGDEDSATLEWRADAYASGANYHAKKFTFLLFINNRSVESARLKRAIEAVYTAIIPKGTSPFVYLSLVLDPSQIDVNVHPTKREVHFLNEEQITEAICDAIQRKLADQNESRTFEYQTLLTGGILGSGGDVERQASPTKRKRKQADDSDGDVIMEGENSEDDDGPEQIGVLTGPSLKDTVKKVLPYNKVRTSLADRTLDSMFAVSEPSSQDITQPSVSVEKGKGRLRSDIKDSECTLTSVKDLRTSIAQRAHSGLIDILEKHIFVGVVDHNLCLALVQYQTRLYLIRYDYLVEELCFQLGVKQFGNFSRLKLQPPPPIRTLIELAVNMEGDKVLESGLSPTETTDTITKFLSDRREMLDEYFSMEINANGELESIPMLLREYAPDLDRLPLFLMRLGPQVDWTSESECFNTFLRELAYFYVPTPLSHEVPSGSGDDPRTEEPSIKASKWQVEHVLFPAMRKYLRPSKEFSDKFMQVANLPDLYRVFERC